MHAALGRARGAAGESDQADVVGGGIASREAVRLGRGQRVQRIGRLIVEIHDLRQAGAVMLVRGLRAEFGLFLQPDIAQHRLDLRLVDDLLELLGTQQRHRWHRHQPRLDGRQPRGGHHRIVRPAQQQAVARHQPHVLGQHAGDAIGQLGQLAVGHRGLLAVLAPAQRNALAMAAFDHGVHQFDRAIEPLRIGHVGAVEQELWPLVARGQIVPGESVDVGGCFHGFPLAIAVVLLCRDDGARWLPYAFSSSRAMINFCTSVAPS